MHSVEMQIRVALLRRCYLLQTDTRVSLYYQKNDTMIFQMPPSYELAV